MCCENSLGLTENYWLFTCQLQGNGCVLTDSWGSWRTAGHWDVRFGVQSEWWCPEYSPVPAPARSRRGFRKRTWRCVGMIRLNSGKLGTLDSTSLSVWWTDNSLPARRLCQHHPSYTMDHKTPSPTKFPADLLFIINPAWFIMLRITSHETAAIWLFSIDGNYRFKKCSFLVRFCIF